MMSFLVLCLVLTCINHLILGVIPCFSRLDDAFAWTPQQLSTSSLPTVSPRIGPRWPASTWLHVPGPLGVGSRAISPAPSGMFLVKSMDKMGFFRVRKLSQGHKPSTQPTRGLLRITWIYRSTQETSGIMAVACHISGLPMLFHHQVPQKGLVNESKVAFWFRRGKYWIDPSPRGNRQDVHLERDPRYQKLPFPHVSFALCY